MFKIEFYVDEKRLGKALIALVGIAHGSPSVVPVVNAEKKGNGLVAKVASGKTQERFAELLKEHKGKTLTPSEIAPMIKALGRAPASRAYIANEAVKAHLLKKRGRGSSTKYTVL